MASPTSSPPWKALKQHQRKIARVHMRDLFAEDAGRFRRFSLALDGLFLDYSKNRVTEETLRLLVDLAAARDVEGWRRRMFAGEPINETEGRAVLHVALRKPPSGGGAIEREVQATLARMRDFSDAIGAGALKGATGQAITEIVNIGIGGSDLGPAMATEALAPYHRSGIGVHFVSNVDGADVAGALARLSPATTLFIVASKTFTTQETLKNALTARGWAAAALGEAAARQHFAAVSANVAAAGEFGIKPERVFPLWDWVGGRFSLWSAVGLPLAIAIGFERFAELLAGARAVDEHFENAPLESNMPVILALLGVWYGDFFDAATHAVIPYDQRLRRLPAYLQQLEMESNGKGVTRDGKPVKTPTAPVIFGEPGTNGQHAFFQLLHQGPRLVPADFIACVEPAHALADHHVMLLSNYFAQTAALMRGRSGAEVKAELERAGIERGRAQRLVAHRTFPGNRPTNSILLDRLDARALGMLIALYEHKVFVEGVLWGINSFDQWGVELGKAMAGAILPTLTSEAPLPGLDGSTQGLLARFKGRRRGVS